MDKKINDAIKRKAKPIVHSQHWETEKFSKSRVLSTQPNEASMKNQEVPY